MCQPSSWSSVISFRKKKKTLEKLLERLGQFYLALLTFNNSFYIKESSKIKKPFLIISVSWSGYRREAWTLDLLSHSTPMLDSFPALQTELSLLWPFVLGELVANT